MNNWKINLSAFLGGLLFAFGLGVAGMTQPQKIIAFLDFTGAWDASLMWVMGSALVVHVISFRMITKRKHPLFDSIFHLPQIKDIDFKLILGSALFGIGWGLSGFCPGPAIVSLVSLQSSVFIFVIAMLIGMLIASRVNARLSK